MRTQPHHTLAVLAALLLAPPAALYAAETTPTVLAPAAAFDVADFGARPNDGKDDTLAIEAAIQASLRSQPAELRFGAGTYHLTRTVSGRTTGADYYIGVNGAHDLAFIGSTDGAGKPATRLERNFVLNDDQGKDL